MTVQTTLLNTMNYHGINKVTIYTSKLGEPLYEGRVKNVPDCLKRKNVRARLIMPSRIKKLYCVTLWIGGAQE